MRASRNVARSEVVSAELALGGRLGLEAGCCGCWKPKRGDCETACCCCWLAAERNRNGCLAANMDDCWANTFDDGAIMIAVAAPPPPAPIWSIPADIMTPPPPTVPLSSIWRPNKKFKSSSFRIVRRFFFFTQLRTSFSLRCWPAATPRS